MSTNRVNRYSITDNSYSLEVGLQSQSSARPGFADDSTRKSWTFNSNGTNSVNLTQTYSPSQGLSPSSKQSIIGLQAKASDSPLQSYQGIPASQCKAVYTGATTQTISASSTAHRYDVETSFYTTDVYGLYRSPTSWIRTVNGVNDIVYNNDKGIPKSYTFPSRTLTVSGSDIFLANANQNQLTTGNNIGRVNIAVAFESNTNETFVHTLSSTGTLTRTWEAYDHIIDGLDGDDAIQSSCSFTMDVVGAIRKYGECDAQSSFSLNEDSVNFKYADPISVVSTTSLAVEPFFILGFNKELISEITFIASTANLKLAESNLSSSSSLSIAPTFKIGNIYNLNSVVSSSVQGGMIYDINSDYSWNTFNLNIYFESGFVEDGFVSVEGEYNWNYLETTAWDDWPTVTWIGNEATWDNWPDDVWEKAFTLRWVGTTSAVPKVFLNIGNALEYTGSFSFAEDSAYNKAAEADLESAFTTEFTASGRIDVTIDMAGAFAPSLVANIRYGLDDTPISITGAFTPVLTANARTDTFADIDVAFALSVSPTFKPSAYLEQYDVESSFEIAPTFKPAGFADLLAFASTLQVGRLFYQADPYWIYRVSVDTRSIMVPVENRIALVDVENRLNTIVAETRGYIVPEETRSIKLRLPRFTDIYSTPRVREEI